MADAPAYVRFRDLCLALPGTKVTITWGAPHLRVGDKIFTGWGQAEDGRSWSFSAKLDKDQQAALVASDPRFSVAAYVGKHGWVSVRIEHGREDWGEIAALVEASYRHVAPGRLIARLDAGGPAAAPRTPAKKAPRAPAKQAPRTPAKKAPRAPAKAAPRARTPARKARR